MNAIGDAPALHGQFASVNNRVYIALTQTGRQSILIFTFSHNIYVIFLKGFKLVVKLLHKLQ